MVARERRGRLCKGWGSLVRVTPGGGGVLNRVGMEGFEGSLLPCIGLWMWLEFIAVLVSHRTLD